MSRQDSWSCLTVEQFLHLSNWEGKSLEQPNWQQQDQSLKTFWQCLTVQQFSSLCNWEGQLQEKRSWQYQDQPLNLPLPPAQATIAPQTSWECLSVKEFFSLSNWQGQPQENHNWQHLDPYSRLKQQVSEFFQFISWEGDPEIGTLPKSAAILTLPSVDDVEHTFADLSDLF